MWWSDIITFIMIHILNDLTSSIQSCIRVPLCIKPIVIAALQWQNGKKSSSCLCHRIIIMISHAHHKPKADEARQKTAYDAYLLKSVGSCVFSAKRWACMHRHAIPVTCLMLRIIWHNFGYTPFCKLDLFFLLVARTYSQFMGDLCFFSFWNKERSVGTIVWLRDMDQQQQQPSVEQKKRGMMAKAHAIPWLFAVICKNCLILCACTQS